MVSFFIFMKKAHKAINFHASLIESSGIMSINRCGNNQKESSLAL